MYENGIPRPQRGYGWDTDIRRMDHWSRMNGGIMRAPMLFTTIDIPSEILLMDHVIKLFLETSKYSKELVFISSRNEINAAFKVGERLKNLGGLLGVDVYVMQCLHEDLHSIKDTFHPEFKIEDASNAMYLVTDVATLTYTIQKFDLIRQSMSSVFNTNLTLRYMGINQLDDSKNVHYNLLSDFLQSRSDDFNSKLVEKVKFDFNAKDHTSL